MVNNYYTLRAVVREIQENLTKEARIEQVYSFRKSELRIRLSNQTTIVALLKPITGALLLSRNVERLPRKNVVSFFESIAGDRVSQITLADFDRTVIISLDNGEIRLQFFGSPNAVLVRENKIISSFKRLAAEKWVERTKPASPQDLLGKRLTKELEYRQQAGVPNDLLDELSNAKGGWVYGEGSSVLFSMVRLLSVEQDGMAEPQRFESTSDALRFVLGSRHHGTISDDSRKDLTDVVTRLIDRSRVVLRQIEAASSQAGRASEYLSIAQSILGVLPDHPDHADSIELDIGEVQKTIPLVPELTLVQNAERYFDLARKAKTRRSELVKRFEDLKKELDSLSSIAEQLRLANTDDEIEKLRRTIDRLAGGSSLHEPRAEAANDDPLARFRQFIVAGGLRLLIGKNAAQNDDLTLHVAKKDDIWLHARGVKGSHGVLQRKTKDKPVPKEAIEEAAAITAYFSDAKTQSIAPVSYAEKKYVRKPRGAAVGAVKMEREEVIMVRPGLPQENKKTKQKSN